MNLLWKSMILAVLFITGCSNENHVPGYIEGEYTYVSSGVAGTLFKLVVERGQNIKQGDLLYQLDPEPERSDVAAAKSNIADLQSQVTFLRAQLDRQQTLFAKHFTPKADLDQAQKDFLSKTHELELTISQWRHSTWALQQKTVYAPVSGKIFDTFYRMGEKVEANHPVLAILAPQNIKVLFYIPEGQLHHIKLHQTVSFTCDGCRGKTDAIVNYISPEAEFTPPIIYSKDTRYKLVYLIKADLPQNIAEQFHPGQPIEVAL